MVRTLQLRRPCGLTATLHLLSTKRSGCCSCHSRVSSSFSIETGPISFQALFISPFACYCYMMSSPLISAEYLNCCSNYSVVAGHSSIGDNPSKHRNQIGCPNLPCDPHHLHCFSDRGCSRGGQVHPLPLSNPQTTQPITSVTAFVILTIIFSHQCRYINASFCEYLLLYIVCMFSHINLSVYTCKWLNMWL